MKNRRRIVRDEVEICVFSWRLSLCVWKYFKKQVLYNKYYANLQKYRAAAIGFFSNIDNQKLSLVKLLGGGFENIYT